MLGFLPVQYFLQHAVTQVICSVLFTTCSYSSYRSLDNDNGNYDNEVSLYQNIVTVVGNHLSSGCS